MNNNLECRIHSDKDAGASQLMWNIKRPVPNGKRSKSTFSICTSRKIPVSLPSSLWRAHKRGLRNRIYEDNQIASLYCTMYSLHSPAPTSILLYSPPIYRDTPCASFVIRSRRHRHAFFPCFRSRHPIIWWNCRLNSAVSIGKVSLISHRLTKSPVTTK